MVEFRNCGQMPVFLLYPAGQQDLLVQLHDGNPCLGWRPMKSQDSFVDVAFDPLHLVSSSRLLKQISAAAPFGVSMILPPHSPTHLFFIKWWEAIPFQKEWTGWSLNDHPAGLQLFHTEWFLGSGRNCTDRNILCRMPGFRGPSTTKRLE